MPKKKAGPEKGKKISRRVNMSHPSAPGSSLRRRAEDKLESEIRKPQSEDLHKLSKEEIQKLVHELRTHQIELEMQNEDLRKAQEELKVSQQRYSDFYDFAPVGFFTFDKNGLILEVNLPGALLLNADRRSLIKKPFPLFVDKEDRDIFLKCLREVFINQETQSCEIRLKIKSGTIHVQIQSIAFEGSEDGTVFCKTVISDITERRRAEHALGESEKKYRQLFENMLDGYAYCRMLFDDNGRPEDFVYIDVNSAFGRLTGLENVVGKKVTEAIPGVKESHPELFEIYGRVALTGRPETFEIEFTPLKIWFSVSVYSARRGYFVAVFENITGRKEAEAAVHGAFELLKINEEKFRSVAQTASDAIISVDSGGRIIFWNNGAEKIFGYSADEVAGGSIAFIIPERSRAGHLKGMKRVLSTGVSEIIGKSIETTGLKRDGSEFPVELSLARWETGEGVFFTAIIRDITGRKRMEEERERLLKELARSNAELEHFAGIASHDLQEPLRMVKSYVQLISDRYKDKLDRDAGEFMDYALQGAVHMQMLINDLLAYSRVGTRSEPFEMTDLNVPLKRALSYLGKSIADSSAEIKVEDLPAAHVDETQMVQLFQNLLGNAVKFCGSAPLRVHISSELKGNEWIIRVSDNGIGIDPKHHDRIFDIFRRLHSTDKYPGTGIGLAVCRKIVERHGGRIWVESEVGKGTTFYFTLPDKKVSSL